MTCVRVVRVTHLEQIAMLEQLADPEILLSLATLTGMEIILGIDNIVFITILCGRLPESHELTARRIGIGVALISRLALLFAISWIIGLTAPIGDVLGLFSIPFSGRDAILFGGGVFLVGKATHEIYVNVELPDKHADPRVSGSHDAVDQSQLKREFGKILVQVIFLDLVFSLDSVITAVGMVDELWVMATAMIIAVGIMLAFAGPVGDFVQKNPSMRILALAFLVLIGVMLVMEGMGQHVSKGYIYAAMGFSLLVELVNLRRLKRMKKLDTLSEQDREREAKIRRLRAELSRLEAERSVDLASKQLP